MRNKTAKRRPRTATKTTRAGRPVLVTTLNGGVFFGYATGATTGETIKLRRARFCIYWSKAMRGFMGLAAMGPDENCRIGPPADIELRNITSISEVAPSAAKRWEAAPWSE